MFMHDAAGRPEAVAKFNRRRVRATKVRPGLALWFYHQVEKWIRQSGKDWAVGRVKALRDCFLKSYSEGELVAKPEWVATTTSGNLKGGYGELFCLAMRSERGLRAVTRLMQVYTTVYHTDSEVDMDAIYHSIAGQTPVYQESCKEARRIYPALEALGIFRKVDVQAPIPLLQVLPHSGQVPRVPWDLERAFCGSFWFDHEDLLVRAVGFNPWLWTSRNWREGQLSAAQPQDSPKSSNPYLDFATQDMGYGFIPHVRYLGFDDEEKVAASLGVHLQAGLKERYFYAPNLVYQRALDPLKEALARVAKSLPWDCTFRQRQPDGDIRSALRRGDKVFSVDLHAATDNFPWGFQKHVLHGLLDRRRWRAGKRNFARDCEELLTDLVENGGIIFERRDGFDLIPPFSKGQPLGAGPSFFLFTISHGLLLFILNNMSWDHKFYVCGDDVVIFDEELYRAYRKVLDKWQIGVSELKSFQSSRLAQFTGMTYTADAQWFSPKWYAPTKDNVLDLCRYWPELRKGLKDEQLISWVLALPEPWGIGLNPSGKTLSERCPDSFWDQLASKEAARAEIARPRATTVCTAHLTAALRTSSIDPDYLWAVLSLLEEDPRVLPFQVGSGDVYLDSFLADEVRAAGYTEDSIRRAIHMRFRPGELMLLDETDVPGFPAISMRKSRDPRTLGTVAQWRKTYSAVNAAKATDASADET